jgi:tetratricopeptide (TPR) repeat protein
VDAHFIKGQLDMLRQQGGDAVSEFQIVVTEKPEFVEGHLRLAEAHLLNKEDSLALDSMLSASNALPGSKELHRGLTQLYIRQKDFAAAEKQLKMILKTDPQDYGAAGSLGDLFAATGQPERAEAQYRKICEQAPDKELGFLKLSRFYAVRKQPDRAVAVLSRALEGKPGSLRLLSGLVKVYASIGQADKALELCRRRLKKDPGQALVHNLMGVVYLSKKDFALAEQALNKAIELEPMLPAPYGNLAKAFLSQGRADAAIEKFKAALAANPRNPGAYLALSKLYEEKEAYQEAIKVYENALAVYPNMWVAANNMAFLLCENARGPNDLARAEAWGQKAVQLHPSDPVVLDTMAWIAFKQGNPDQALLVMEKAIAKAPEDPALNYHMGAILTKSGKVIEAREKLLTALANGNRFPGREAAEALLTRLNK